MSLYLCACVYLATRHGVLALITFALLVPLDVGAYFWLRIAARGFFDPLALSKLGLAPELSDERLRRSRIGFVFHQAACIGVALWIQHSAMSSEICAGIPRSPWVSPPGPVVSAPLPVKCSPQEPDGPRMPAQRTLTTAGAIHYVTRGIGAYMAVNFLMVFVVVFAQAGLNLAVAHPAQVFTPARKPNPLVKTLGLSLLVALLLGVLATTFEGIALFLIAWKPVSWQPGDLVKAAAKVFAENRQFFNVAWQSTWLYWLAMSILVTGLTIATLRRLQSVLSRGKEALLQDAMARLDAYGPASSRAEYESYWATVEAINAMGDRVETLPVSGLKSLVGSAVALQVFAFLPRVATAIQGLVSR